jgi:nucleoside-diphosphate-sugar epimerase
MKILILGGNRFFGRHLADSLLGGKNEITLLNRGTHPDGFGDKVERLQADRKSKAELSRVVQGRTWDLVFDQICYTAAEAHEACEIFNGKVDRYVVTSSESVYDSGSQQTEDCFDPLKYEYSKAAEPNENYQEAKRQVEHVFARASQFSVAIVRPSLVVGLDDYTKRLNWHLERVQRGQPMYFPNLKAKVDFVRSDQAGLAMKVIGLSSHRGPINCTAPGAIALEDLVMMCESAIGKKAILATSPTDDNQSPYGFEHEKTMSTVKLQTLGFHADPSPTWMRELVLQSGKGLGHESRDL